MKILKFVLLIILIHNIGFYILDSNNEFNVYSYNIGSIIGSIVMVIYFNALITKND